MRKRQARSSSFEKMVVNKRAVKRRFKDVSETVLGFLFGLCIRHFLSSFVVQEVANAVPGPKDFCQPSSEMGDSNSSKVVFVVRKASARTCLHPAEACALESAARSHPDLVVRLQISSSSTPCSTLDAVREAYLNIQIDNEENGRLPTIQKCVRRLKEHSGICLNTNVLTLRPLHCLENVLGHNNLNGNLFSVVQSGVMIFQSDHPFLDYITQSGYLDGYHVPNGLTKAVQSFCNYSGDVFPLSQDFSCAFNSTIGLLTSELLHPFTSWEAAQDRLFFHPTTDSKLAILLARLEQSFTVNFYQTPFDVVIDKDSFFAHLAQAYCPRVYSAFIDV